MDLYYSVSAPLVVEKWQADKLNKRLDYIRSIYNNAANYISKRYSDITQKKMFKHLKDEKSIIHFLLDNTYHDIKNNTLFSLTKFGICHYIMSLVKSDIGNNTSYKQKGICSHSVEYIGDMLYKSVISSIKQHKTQLCVSERDSYHFNTMCFRKSNERFDGMKINLDKQILYLNMNGRQRNQATFLKLRIGNYQKCGKYICDNMPKDTRNVFAIYITRRLIRGNFKYYVIFCLKGSPKYNDLKLGKGIVGIDLGPSTISYSSINSVGIKRLNNDLSYLENKAINISSKMNRSRKFTNPDKYNEDGTYKQKTKGSVWIKSNRYLRLQQQHLNCIRKMVAIRNLYHQTLIREIISYGDTFIVEKNEFWKWKKKSSEGKIDLKTGRTRSKKSRLGKSIKSNAPRHFLDKLSEKAKYLGGEVNIVSIKNAATQFDFTCQQFVKRELKEKEITLSDNSTHHRDILAAFNLQHLNYKSNNLKDYNIEEMKKHYLRFTELERQFLDSTQ